MSCRRPSSPLRISQQYQYRVLTLLLDLLLNTHAALYALR